MPTPTESAPAAPAAAPVQIDAPPPSTNTNAGMTGQRVPPSSEGAPREKQVFREENPSNVTMGDDKGNREVEPTLPKFGEAARKMLEKKQAEAREEPKPEKKEEAPKKKAPAISIDDGPPTKPKADEPIPDHWKKILPSDKPEHVRRFKYFIGEASTAKEEAAAAKAEAVAAKAELEAAKKAGAAPEELTKLREEASNAAKEAARYRRMVEIEKDPEIIAKYDEPSKQAEASIEAALKQAGIGEPTLKVIQAEGGFAAFSRSQKTYNVTVPDPDIEGQTRVVAKTASQLAHEWLNGMNLADAEAIKSSLGKQQLLASEKSAAKAAATAEATQYYENQTKAQQEAQQAAQASQQKATKEYEEWAKKAESDTEFLKDRSLPEGATADQKKAIEEYNTFNAQLRESLKKHPTTALEYGQLKLEAAEGHHLRRVMGEKEAEIEALRAQLARARGATRTTAKSGSILTGGSKTVEKESNADPTDLKGGLRASLARITGEADE